MEVAIPIPKQLLPGLIFPSLSTFHVFTKTFKCFKKKQHKIVRFIVVVDEKFPYSLFYRMLIF